MNSTNNFASIDDLPAELVAAIFEYLKIQDLIQCRLVCKRFMLISNFSIVRELIISDQIENVNAYWFHTKRQFNHMDAIDVKTFSACRSIFRLEKFLRRLHFKGDYMDYVQLNLNSLTQLQQLKINIAADDWCNARPTININLPKLEVLEIDANLSHAEPEFYLTAPNLKMLKCEAFDRVHLSNPETINYLETMFYHENVQLLKNLQYLKVDMGFLMNANDRNILLHLPALKTLVCNLFTYDGEEDFIEDTIRHLVEQKRTLMRSDLKIYYHSVELLDIEQIDEWANLGDLAFQIKYYHSLTDNIRYNDSFNYNELMALVDGNLPDDFCKKYFNIPDISVTGEVENRDQLLAFLKSLHYLKTISLEKTSLDQSFFDNLNEVGRLTSLTIIENSMPITNYNFLLKLKVLDKFSTNCDSSDFLDLTIELFKQLKYFRFIHFYFQKQFIGISKCNGYVFYCYLDTSTTTPPLPKKLLFEKRLMNFEQLVSFIEDFRGRENDLIKK